MRTRRQFVHGLGAIGASALALRPSALFGSTVRSAVDFDMPAGACDCHVHVFDPKKFPYAARRVYTPPDALVSDLLDLQKALRLERVVVVQPSVYAADNACTLDAVRQLGARARGVAVIDKSTTQAQLDEMHAIGVRGIRLNLNTTPSGAVDADGSKRTLEQAAEQLRGRNWHIQFYTRPPVIAALKEPIEQLPFATVFDHFGAAQAKHGANQPGFDALLDLVKSGKTYVKLSAPYRISEHGPAFADSISMAQALIAANPDRLVWGTDWPHPDSAWGVGKPLTEIAPPFEVDDGLVLNQLAKWAPDAALRRKILVDNPARLYDFAAVEAKTTGSVPAMAK